MNSFLTGSIVYGKFTTKSDIDLVVLVDTHTAKVLRQFSESKLECHEVGTPPTVRFGRLNLIICDNELDFAVWKAGTEANKLVCESEGKQDKEKAKALFDVMRKMVNTEDKGGSG